MKERRRKVSGLISFSETQKVSPWFAIAILFSGNGLSIFMLMREIVSPGKDASVAIPGLSFLVLFILVLTILLMRAKLETVITNEGVFVRYFPFQRSYVFMSVSIIEKLYVRNFDAFSEYGGIGIKGRRRNIAYTVNNDYGIQIELKDGSRLLIGTERRAHFNNAEDAQIFRF